MNIRVSYSQYLQDAALSVFVLVLIYLIRRWRVKFPFPPGPSGYPIIGNIFDMPTVQHWQTYTKWGKQYGAFPPYYLTEIFSDAVKVHFHLLGLSDSLLSS